MLSAALTNRKPSDPLLRSFDQSTHILGSLRNSLPFQELKLADCDGGGVAVVQPLMHPITSASCNGIGVPSSAARELPTKARFAWPSRCDIVCRWTSET